jgi:hypothetical protein
MSTIYDNPGAGWNRINTDDYFRFFSKQMKWVMCYNKQKNLQTPQQFEQDHNQLMTMRNIKAVCSKSNERSFVIQCVMNE